MTTPYIVLERHHLPNPAYIKTVDDFMHECCTDIDALREYREYMNSIGETYEGHVNGFTFTRKQLGTYEKIQTILNEYNCYLTCVHAGETILQCGINGGKRFVKFVVHDPDMFACWNANFKIENENVIYINYIYIGPKKIRLPLFLAEPGIYLSNSILENC